MNQTAMVMMAGHVVTAPKLAQTKSGQPFTKVRIGVTTRRPDRQTGEWQDVTSSYFTVSCWRRMAMNATASLRRGDPVVVWGRLKSRTWVDANGQKHRIIDIEADSISHDGSMGWTMFQRGATPGAAADEMARRELAAAEDMDAQGDNGEADDFVDHGFARDGLAPDSDPGDGAVTDMAASADGDPFGNGSSFGDGNPFRAEEPGDDEVPAATAADPVAALEAEAAPF